ncbi:MAG: sigma-70 family RNA polymerase sigma factor [Clostridia bacterium]|nr:sigma-70 family RNA polymerase sigma factor [Clostridia bacterium]
MPTKTRDETTLENIGLVHSIANRFRGRGIEYDDLFGAGCLGLIKAADRFDESRGLCFSTYAVPLIMGEIKSLFRKSGVVKVSRTLKEVYIKAARISEEYASAFGGSPTITQIAERLGVDEDIVSQAFCACRAPLSLSADDRDGEDSTPIDIPVESEEESITERISLEKALDSLPDEDKRLIELRYFKGLTQTQTADILGISQVQVCRKEKKILTVLRTLMQ